MPEVVYSHYNLNAHKAHLSAKHFSKPPQKPHKNDIITVSSPFLSTVQLLEERGQRAWRKCERQRFLAALVQFALVGLAQSGARPRSGTGSAALQHQRQEEVKLLFLPYLVINLIQLSTKIKKENCWKKTPLSTSAQSEYKLQ